MSAKFIPVEHLGDYQPWHFSVIEQKTIAEEMDPAQSESAISSELEEAAVNDKAESATADDIGQIYHDAHREGYEAGLVEGLEAGHMEGFERGHAEGLEAGQKAGLDQITTETKPLLELFSSFSKAVEITRQQIAQDIVTLALDVAREMTREALIIKPELVIAVVKDAIESMPQGIQHPVIYLNPKDSLLIKDMLEEGSFSEWKVMDDSRIERGGCRIECTTAELDATMPSRWQRIATTLAQDHSWLEHGR